MNHSTRTATWNSFRENWKRDFSSSLVVFLVALPLCMGIAIASGAPPAAGIITGIVGGIVVGSLAGSPLQVSGPAAGLTVIVYDIVQRFGYESLGVILVLAGIMQFTAGCLRLGQWFRAVSPAVIQGMLAGIGVLIFASQFHVMVDDAPRKGGIANLVSLPESLIKGIVPLDGSSHHIAAGIGLLTIVAIVLWKPLAPKKLRFLPAPLIGIVLASIVTASFNLGIKVIDIPNNLMDSIALPTLGVVSEFGLGTMILQAVLIAAVASAETLLCATAVDQMHSGPRTKYDQELSAQGVGNLICGLLGGLPMTGVIVRSSANVDSGAKTRLSAILHGVWLLGFISLLPFALRFVPVSSLAALLVYTGYKLMNPKAVRQLWKAGRSEVFIYAMTVTVIVAEDLLTGVIVGIVLSALKLLYTFSHLGIRVTDEPQENRTTIYLDGSATFIRLPKLAAVLEALRPDTELHVNCESLTYIDHACLELLTNWAKQHQTAGGQLSIDWDSLNSRFRAPATPTSNGHAEDPNAIVEDTTQADDFVDREAVEQRT